jgi:hypothetical protein
MDDYVTYLALGSSVFFVVVGFALMYRYRQVSQNLTKSSDLGKDLWSALESRMRKQDERILDLLARLEVLQARLPPLSSSAREPEPTKEPLQPETPQVRPGPAQVIRDAAIEVTPVRPPEPHVASQPLRLDETQTAAISFLRESPRNTREITDFLRKSREHTARIMKTLFELGLVERNDATKPFVYQLTESGRRALPSA